MVDTMEVWSTALDRFADLLDRIEAALELGDFEDPQLVSQLANGTTIALPPFPIDPELQRRATALREEGERLAGLIVRRRDEMGAELAAGGDRRTAARRYRRAERLAQSSSRAGRSALPAPDPDGRTPFASGGTVDGQRHTEGATLDGTSMARSRSTLSAPQHSDPSSRRGRNRVDHG